MNASIIYHICTRESWEAQSENKIYVHDSLEEEDFIHCSESQQVEGVLERYFKDENNLLMLAIESKKLISKLQYDAAPNGEFFPHIYGPINKDAIVAIKKIKESV